MRAVRCVLLSLLLFVSGLTEAQATLIDLNDFFADPTVTVAGDGSSATIAEDPGFFSVLLSNDPFFGDPNVIVPGLGLSLTFDFVFSEPFGNDDEFGVFILDAATGASVGPAGEFFVLASASGTVSFDLTLLVGLELGLQFQLSALPFDGGLDSTVTVSDLRIEEAVPVPEPPAWIVFIGGLMIALLCGRLAPGRIES